MATDPKHGEQRPFQLDDELSRILRSTPFHGSKQCQVLLKYLVDHALKGQEGALKERTIGIEVFGREHDYNTAEDPVVRARVGEVRKRLAQYYVGLEAEGSAVQIVIPSGSYRPIFMPRPETEESNKESPAPITEPTQAVPPQIVDDPAPLETPVSGPGLRGKSRWRVWGLAAVACIVLVVAWLGIARWTRSDLDIFWQPILVGKKPVVIYFGTAPVYIRSMYNVGKDMSLLKPDEKRQPALKWSIPPLAEGQVLTAKDVLVDSNGYVEVGDVTAAVNVTGLLNSRRQSFDLRMGPDLAFEDLHSTPTILLGSFANFWTMAMNSDLPFYFDRNLDIRERGGQGRVWSISHGPGRASSSTITEDYAIVYRLVDSKTGAPVVTLAGTTTCGTRAVSEFVTDPVRMRRPQSIPRDAWERRNLALIFHTSLINCNPTSVDAVATKAW